MTAPEAPLSAEKLRAGDRETLEAVYRAHLAEVRRVLAVGFRFSGADGERKYLRVTSAFDRDELCQETFAELFRQFREGRFDASRPVRPYVVRIAMNLALRKIGRQAREVLSEGAGLEIAVAPPEADAPERVRLVAEFRASLDDGDRAVLGAYFEDEASQEAVGSALGLSRDQVYRAVVRIRRKALAFFKSRGW